MSVCLDVRGARDRYGNKNAVRETNHIIYFVKRFDFKYFLRVDDDGFLCFRQLLDELRWHLPKLLGAKPLLHGKYHCHAAKVGRCSPHTDPLADACALRMPAVVVV